jgi:hypothetical protein
MRVFAFLGLALATGCGLSLDGGLFGTPETPDAGREASVTPLPTMTTGGPNPGIADAGNDVAAEAGPDATIDNTPDVFVPPPPPTAANVTVSYAAGKDKKIYKLIGSTFTALTSDKCPAGEETAVMTGPRVFVTSSDSTELYSVDPATGACSPIKKGGVFRFALGVAPKGTLSPTADTLIGYQNSDYVTINETTGMVTVILANALGGQVPRGDVTAVNTSGYVSIRQDSGSGTMQCKTGDCIQQVDLATGSPVGTPVPVLGSRILGLAQDRGNLLLFRNDGTDRVSSYSPLTKLIVVDNVAAFPSNANFTGAGAAPWQ